MRPALGQTEQSVTVATEKKTETVRFLLHLPPRYYRDSQAAWPVILFLHGSDERGDSLDMLKRHGLPELLERKRDLPFIVVSPQLARRKLWSPELLNGFMDRVEARFRADRSREYLTGLSLGGDGVWATATRYPDRFAAVIPICGSGNPKKAGVLKDVPVWIFHGQNDRAVPVRESVKMADALRACGGNVTCTIYPDREHDAWSVTYANPLLYDWMLSHSRPR
jgi:predicted peptidase